MFRFNKCLVGSMRDLYGCFQMNTYNVNITVETAASIYNQLKYSYNRDNYYKYMFCFTGLICQKSVSVNLRQIVVLLEELTRERFIPAYDLLGNCYYNGEGCIKSPEKATQYYLYAHNSGYKNSTAHLALHYFLVNQNVKGQALIEECLKGDYGDVYGYAYFIKGYGYQFGKYGYPVDKAKALALYEAGAKELDIKSSYYAAVMYNVGIGCAVDHYKALKYFERAAMFDEAEAQYMTGKYYFNGEYVAINYDRAFAYFEQAFKNGHLAAKTYLGVCYLNGKGCWIDEDLGLRYIKEAASAGEPIAKKLLAKMNL